MLAAVALQGSRQDSWPDSMSGTVIIEDKGACNTVVMMLVRGSNGRLADVPRATRHLAAAKGTTHYLS